MPNYDIVHILTIPLYIYSIYKLMRSFFVHSANNKKVEIISYSVYLIASALLIFVTRVPVFLLAFNLLSMFFLSLNYTETLLNRIRYIILIYSLIFIIEIMVSVLVGNHYIIIIEDSQFDSIIGLILIRTVTMIFSYLFYKYQRAKQQFEIPKVYYIGFIVILLGTLYLFILSLNSIEITFSNILISSLVLIIVNITIMFIEERIYNAILLEYEANILKAQNIAYENQTALINQTNYAIKSLKHDVKNHLIVLDELYKSNHEDEVAIYSKKIFEKIDNAKLSHSNNFIFDSILNYKLKDVEQKNICLNLDISIPENINILAYDITVILGNLLDNALQALEKVQDKKLDLSICCSMGNLVILIDNTYDGNIIKHKEIFQTTKSSKENHGIGIQNMKKTLKSYNGHMEISYSKNVFSVSVMIPYI